MRRAGAAWMSVDDEKFRLLNATCPSFDLGLLENPASRSGNIAGIAQDRLHDIQLMRVVDSKQKDELGELRRHELIFLP
jgi:hypothetical protein